MSKIYTKENGFFVANELADLSKLDSSSIAWIDLLNPSAEEMAAVSSRFGVEFPTMQERESIESSSRYWEDESCIWINAFFFVSFFFFADKQKEHCNESVSFIIKDNILFTLRNNELKSFNETHKKITQAPLGLTSGYDIFMQIFDARVEADADLIEYAAKEINKLRKEIFSLYSKLSDDEILEKISTIQEFNLKVRESISDKRRIVIGLLKSNKITEKHRADLGIMIKDITSLIEFTTINLNALDNIQNLFIGQINIDQNKVIKLFTVVNVVLMPPTLIASIYGMNFEFMPELKWEMGYPFSLMLMALSSIIPLWYFKKKNWF